MTWWIGSLLATVTIAAVEYINRHAPEDAGWWAVFPQTFPLFLLSQWGLYHAFHGASHWMWAWAFFTVGNSLMRVTSVYFLAGQEIASWGYVGLGVAATLGGVFFIKQGLT